MSGKTLYTPKEAAEELGLSDQTIYRYIDRGVFQGVIERGMLKKRYLNSCERGRAREARGELRDYDGK